MRDTRKKTPRHPGKKKRPAKRAPEISLETAATEDASDAEQVSRIRALLRDRPDCVEEGLSIYTDTEALAVGTDFETGVGQIDLLARDNAGGLVVVLVPAEPSPGAEAVGKDLVSEALERVGWVRKHVAEPQQEVRCIVLLEHAPDDLSYSAAAVASTVAFKTYRMEVSFSDVEV